MTLNTCSDYVDSGLVEKDKITVGLKIGVGCCGVFPNAFLS